MRSFLALRLVFANCFHKMVRSGVQRGWDFGEGGERGVIASIVVVRAERAEENHWSSWLGEGVSGRRGISQFLSLSVRPGHSAFCQCGLGISFDVEGGRIEIRMGASSDPVEERANTSQERQPGNMPFGKDEVNGTSSVGFCKVEPSVNAGDVEKGEA